MEKGNVVRIDRVILFTDVHNFSIATNVLGERLADFLQEMYETLGEIVVNHQGELVKYLGDGLLCIFEVGLEQEAVASAVVMRKAFTDMVERWALPADTELEVGIGEGKVVEGVFGHRTLRQREVYGNVVNEVARIGHHRGIAITEKVYERVRESYAVHQLADVAVKWQEAKVKVWEVKA